VVADHCAQPQGVPGDGPCRGLRFNVPDGVCRHMSAISVVGKHLQRKAIRGRQAALKQRRSRGARVGHGVHGSLGVVAVMESPGCVLGSWVCWDRDLGRRTGQPLFSQFYMCSLTFSPSHTLALSLAPLSLTQTPATHLTHTAHTHTHISST